MFCKKYVQYVSIITLLGSGCQAGFIDSPTDFDDGATSTGDSGSELVRAGEGARTGDTETATGDESEDVPEQEPVLELASTPSPVALGKECSVTCTVANVGTGMCPATMSGFGYTTFLGGCKKACRKARGDAASKLPEGCQINSCIQSCD